MINKFCFIMKVVVFINLLICLFNRLWAATFICLFNFILFFIFDIIKNKFNYDNFLHLLIYFFLVSSLLGGEVFNLYSRIWFFDIILHTLSSFIISGFAMYLIKYFNLRLNLFMLILFVFSISMMIASLWEIFEFSVDRVFSIDMQKDTIINEINSTLLSSDGNSVINKKIERMSIGELSINGYIDIGLYDTIYDMICALFGSVLYLIFSKLKEAF